MPQTLGPYTTASTPKIVPGTAFSITIDRAAQAIQIHNDSPYRLYFQFDGQKPTATNSMSGQYVGMAAPWSHPVLPVQRTAASGYERMLNAIRDFQGILWVMVIDPTAALAQTGTVSTLAEIHVDVYLPGENWPQSWAIPRQQDLTSQPRVVTVPMALDSFSFFTGRVTTPAAGARVQISPNLSINPSSFVSMVFYLYQVVLTPGFNAGGAGGMDCLVVLDCLDAALTPVGVLPFPITMLRQSLWWTAAAGPYDKLDWKSNYPLGIEMSPPANAAYLAVFMFNGASANTPVAFDYMVGMGTDTGNTNITPGLIGTSNAGHLF